MSRNGLASLRLGQHERLPRDLVMRMAPVPPEPKRYRSGLEQFATYKVAQVARYQRDLVQLAGVGGWHRLTGFDVVLHEPCA